MEYNIKRQIQIVKERLFNREHSLKKINNLLTTDNLSCIIYGYDDGIHKTHEHSSTRKSLIKEILIADREIILQDIDKLKKELIYLTEGDIYMGED